MNNTNEEDGFSFYNYTVYKMNSEVNNVDDEVLLTLIIGASFGALGFLTMCIQLWCQKSTKNHLFCYFNYQHTFSSALHLILITYLYTLLRCDVGELDTRVLGFVFQVSTYLTLITLFWTACISLKMFSDLFLFENGVNVYTISEVTLFTYISALVIEFYEEIVIVFMYAFLSSSDPMTVPAVRLTSNLIILSIAVAMLFVILLNCIRRDGNSRFMSAVYLIHLFILISADIILVAFKVRNSKDLEVFICAVLLSGRMIFETVLTLLIKSDLPVLKHFNYY